MSSTIETTKKAILFDFDYTITDSSKGVFECVDYALAHMGESSVIFLLCVFVS